MPIRGGARCPQLPLSLCPRLWDERHIPIHGTEDVEMWGRGLSRKEHWSRWMLVAACLLGAGSATLGGAAVRSVASRLVLAVVSGLLLGSYLALEVVPEQAALQVRCNGTMRDMCTTSQRANHQFDSHLQGCYASPTAILQSMGLMPVRASSPLPSRLAPLPISPQILVVLSCLVVVAFVVLLQLPAASVPGLLPMVFAGWLVVLGLTMLLQTELPVPQVDASMQRLFPDSKTEVRSSAAVCIVSHTGAFIRCYNALFISALLSPL